MELNLRVVHTSDTAKIAIECLRGKTGKDIGLHLEAYRVYIENGGEPLIDEEELGELRRSGYLARAKKELGHLRSSTNDQAHHVHILRNSMEQGEFGFELVGLTAEECVLYKITV
jgi:hypothetical protein